MSIPSPPLAPGARIVRQLRRLQNPRSRSRSPSRSPSRQQRDASPGGKAFFTPCGASRSDIAFLGTGSAIPSKYRNVTGMLARLSPAPPAPPASPASPASPEQKVGAPGTDGVQLRGVGGLDGTESGAEEGRAGAQGGSIILDAGEGTMGQIWRMFGDGSSGGGGSPHAGGGGEGGAHAGAAGVRGGKGGVQQALRDLSAVWISHPHADHHLGLVKILSERNKLLREGVGAGTGSKGAGVGAAAAGAPGAKLPNLLLMAPAPVAAWLKVSSTVVLRGVVFFGRAVAV